MTEKQEPLRAGIVGAHPTLGWARQAHVPALQALPEFELVAVCTTRRETAEAAAAQFGVKEAFWSVPDLVSSPDIDVIIVSVRAPSHYDAVMAALEQGKHVYCEWPLAVNSAQAQEMAAMARSKNLRNMVGLQSRGDPNLVHLHDLVRNHWAGELVSVNMVQILPGLLDERHPTRVWKADKEAATNSLTKDGGHALDALFWCVGHFTDLSAVVSVRATEWPVEGDDPVPVTGPDHVAITGVLAGGVVANVTVATVPWHAPGVRIEIYGTEGTLFYTTQGKNVNRGTGLLRGGRRTDPEVTDIEIPAALRWAPSELAMPDEFKVGQMLRRFGEGIRGGFDPAPTFADAATHQHLLETVERSWSTRSWVRWDPADLDA